MNIMVSRAQGRVPVTILHMHGELDASSYRDLIATAEEAIRGGAQDILLDLSDTPYMSSSGLVALQSIAAMLRGEAATDLDGRLPPFNNLERDREIGVQAHFKLLNPQPRVEQVLKMVGFRQFLEVYTDLEEAVASF